MTLSELVEQSLKNDMDLAGYVLVWQSSQMGCEADAIRDKLQQSLQVMKEAVQQGISGELPSRSGISGGDACRVRNASPRLLGNISYKAVVYALATAEVNAAMGRIVAAPTAGASGVLPGVLLAAAEELGFTDEQLIEGLVVAGAIGLVIAEHSTLAGAEGGCQAECGSGSAMAAGALTHLLGGDAEAVMHAAALALKNQMGLVCDPVAGLVEVPCIKRNGGSAVNAIMAAELALAGVRSFIPPDEVIQAVAEVGRSLPSQLKETGQGGLANTPTARAVERRLFKP